MPADDAGAAAGGAPLSPPSPPALPLTALSPEARAEPLPPPAAAPLPSTPPLPPTARRHRRWRRAAGLAFAGVLALVLAVAWGEHRGWPWLAGPAERRLSQRLDRPVQLSAAASGPAPGFVLHLLGGVSLQVAQLRIGQPAWLLPAAPAPASASASAPTLAARPRTALPDPQTNAPMLLAQGLQLTMHWRDLIAWRPGRPVVLQALSADHLALQLRRLDDGRANWVLGSSTPAPDAATGQPPLELQVLRLRHGTVQLVDQPLQLALQATLGVQADGLVADALGSFRSLPLRAHLHSPLVPVGSGPPGSAGSAGAAAMPGTISQLLTTDGLAVPLLLQLSVGRAKLDFAGQVRDPWRGRGLAGRYTVSGPSLAAVGQPMGLTLPTTDAFWMQGGLVRDGLVWRTVVDEARIGRSRLAGDFQLSLPAQAGAVPLLAGRLRGPALYLQDLGPAIGASSSTAPQATHVSGKVLPDRPFNIPSLRAMDANVLVNLQRLDFGTPALQAAAPLRAHLLLQGGQLALQDIHAVLAQGQVSGTMRLDGRAPVARWAVDLRGRGLQLATLVRPLQRPDGPPWASGALAAGVVLQGQGQSTAQWLASAQGRLQLHWTQGTVSHLAVEAAGLDLAQGLGVWLKGDDNLRVDCAVADLAVAQGRVAPRLALVDTRDSTLWLDGSLSLASERLALVAHVQPKDKSPLTLRTPLHIDGTLAKPALSLEKGPLLRRAIPAALLALLNPWAALLPLIDLGGPTANGALADGAAACQRLARLPRSAGGV